MFLTDARRLILSCCLSTSTIGWGQGAIAQSHAPSLWEHNGSIVHCADTSSSVRTAPVPPLYFGGSLMWSSSRFQTTQINKHEQRTTIRRLYGSRLVSKKREIERELRLGVRHPARKRYLIARLIQIENDIGSLGLTPDEVETNNIQRAQTPAVRTTRLPLAKDF